MQESYHVIQLNFSDNKASQQQKQESGQDSVFGVYETLGVVS